MTSTQERKPIRVWPGIVAVILQWFAWLVLPKLVPEAAFYGLVLGIVGGGALVLVWWLFFSRAPWLERLGAIGLMVVAAFAIRPFLDKSILGGAMGMLLMFLSIPIMGLGLVVWAVVARRLDTRTRHVALVATVLAVCGVFLAMRTEGITGEGGLQLAPRWTKTPEEKLLARAVAERPPVPVPAPAPAARVQTPKVETPAEGSAPRSEPIAAAVRKSLPTAAPRPSVSTSVWPGFRGPHRDDIVTGLRINTDWTSTPPKEIWRRPIGPGWSSFAVADDLIYTQEQRGDFELVTCYRATTGEPVWTHPDNARFYESNGGPGPRGTPTFHDGRLYTFGATGIVNALDAASGAVVWKRNAADDTGAKLPGWGFSSSPLVVNDAVIVAASGRMVSYDLATGKTRWKAEPAGGSYSSPHLLTTGGVAQVVLLGGKGALSVAPADGKVLWKHDWSGVPIVQPALTGDGGVLIAVSDSSGTRRLAIAQGPDGWSAKEVWTSTGLKPYFNDIVIHNGHAYGFDGGILSCIDLQDGKRKWKGGRYGHGQLLLLADQDLLLVVSEEGELVLVSATPDQFTEVARHSAIEGKTWNHPVVAGDLLLVRNGQEMVAFRLARAGG